VQAWQSLRKRVEIYVAASSLQLLHVDPKVVGYLDMI
jgi:hypothetical protein